MAYSSGSTETVRIDPLVTEELHRVADFDNPIVQYGNNLMEPMRAPHESPPESEAFDIPVLGGALRGFDLLQRVAFDAPLGLARVGLARAGVPGAADAQEERDLAESVNRQIQGLPPMEAMLRAPYLYAAGASEVKRAAVRKMADSGDIAYVDTPLGRITAIDAVEGLLPVGGVFSVAKRAAGVPGAVGKALAAPEGEIGRAIRVAAEAGATPEKAAAEAISQFGDNAVMNFVTKGDDVFIDPVLAGSKAGGAVDAGASAGRAAAQADPVAERAAQQLGEDAQRFEGGEAFERGQSYQPPVESNPKFGTGAARENAGFNPAKIDAPKETKDYIAQVSKANDGFEKQRRGVVTVAETNEAAQRVLIDVEKYAHIKPGTSMSAETLAATRGAMIAKGKEVVALQDIVAAQRAAKVVSAESELQLLVKAAEHQTLQRVFAGGRAEAGRSLRILKEVGTALDSGQTQVAYARAVAALGSKGNVDGFLKTLQAIWTDPKLSATNREIATYQFIQNLEQPKFFDKMNEFWMNAVLSGPVTHAVNVSSQTIMQIAENVAKFGAVGVEAVSTIGGLRRPREIFFSEAMAGTYGTVAGILDGWKRGMAMLRNGITPGEIQKFKESGTYSVQALRGKPGAILNIPSRVLGAEDQIFYGMGYQRSLYEQAANVAAKERISPFSRDFAKRVTQLVASPTDEIMAKADAAGKRAGLRSDPGELTRKVIDLRDVGVELGPLGKLAPLKYVFPFINTPVQLVKIGAQYTPAGFVGAIRSTGAERSMAITRSLMGSAAMGYFASQYATGNLTAGPPRDPAEKDAFYAAHKLPYAFKWGDKWVEFGRMEPISTPLRWMAIAMEEMKQNPNQSLDVVATKITFAVIDSLRDSTYMSGMSDLIDAVQDPTARDKFVGRIATGFIPAFERQAVQVQDPFIRDPKGIWAQIKAALPGLNETVPIRQNVYGEDVRRTESQQGLAGYFNPVKYQTERVDPVTTWLQGFKLPENLDENGNPLSARGVLFSVVDASIASFKLDRDTEGKRFQKIAGQALYDQLEALKDDKLLYDGKKFSQLDYADQIRAIRKARADAHDVGAAQVADEIMAAATNSGQRSRAAVMRLSTLDSLREKSDYLAMAHSRGQIDRGSRDYIDSRRGKDEPTVDEFISVQPKIQQYLQTRPFRIGDPAEWQRLEAARKASTEYVKTHPKPESIPTWQWYYQADPEGAKLLFQYGRDIVEDPRRKKMRDSDPLLRRFVSDLTYKTQL